MSQNYKNINSIKSHLIYKIVKLLIQIFSNILNNSHQQLTSINYMNYLSSQHQPNSILNIQQQLLQSQKSLHIENLITAFQDPSIKNLQSFNKNKVQRQLLQIATDFYGMMDKLDMIKWFCIDYRTTLQSYKKQQLELQKQKLKLQQQEAQNDLQAFSKQQKMIQESLQNTIPLYFQQQLSLNSNNTSTKPFSNNLIQFNQQQNDLNSNKQQQVIQQQTNPKPLVVLPAKRLQTSKQQVQSVINKLKVMIVKVNTKQSSSFQHVYSTYISRLKYTLQNSNLDQKRFKMYKIKNILNYLPKKYVLLKLQSRSIYPYHPTRYPNPELIGYQYIESPMFFINFFSQQLLFFNFQPIILKRNFSQLLYCPIILVKGKAQQSLKISGWYYEQLSKIQPLWRSTVLLIKVYNEHTSLKHPIYYSHISIKKFEFPNELKNDLNQVHRSFHFMDNKYSNQQQLLSDLQTIKQYIYQTLIFNHLRKVLDKQPKQNNNQMKKVYIHIQGGFKIQFQLVTDLEIKQTLKNINNINNNKKSEDNYKIIHHLFHLPQKNYQIYPEPIYKPQLIAQLLLFYKRKNLFTIKRFTLLQDIQILFKTILFKIITQDLQYRTVSPAYSGSVGLYYYQKKTIKKNSVKDFLSNFNKK